MAEPVLTVVARHVETTKNTLGIHGRSDRDEITATGVLQAARLAEVAASTSVDRLVWVSTAQARATARLVSHISGIPLADELSLRPFSLGVAAGISHEEFLQTHPSAAASLEAFRFRRSDATELALPGAESISALDNRLRRWWRRHRGAELVGAMVVTSSSTLTMIANAAALNWPLSGRYVNYPSANGGFRVFTGADLSPMHDLKLSAWPMYNEPLPTLRHWQRGWEIREERVLVAGQCVELNAVASELALIGFDVLELQGGTPDHQTLSHRESYVCQYRPELTIVVAESPNDAAEQLEHLDWCHQASVCLPDRLVDWSRIDPADGQTAQSRLFESDTAKRLDGLRRWVAER